jgi:hypothetical protein
LDFLLNLLRTCHLWVAGLVNLGFWVIGFLLFWPGFWVFDIRGFLGFSGFWVFQIFSKKIIEENTFLL